MKRNLLRKEEDSDPMSVVSNLFDVAMVFAVALMVALVTRYNMTEMFSQEDFTMVKVAEMYAVIQIDIPVGGEYLS